MIYAYTKSILGRDDIDEQILKIKNFSNRRKLKIDEWIDETESLKKKVKERQIGKLIDKTKKNDILIVSEISSLGKGVLEIMNILNILMKKNVKVYSIKEKYELTNNLKIKGLAFTFELAENLARDLVSQRAKQSLAQKKREGMNLGRPAGKAAKTKLTGKEELIQSYLDKKVAKAAIARLLNVSIGTLYNFMMDNKGIFKEEQNGRSTNRFPNKKWRNTKKRAVNKKG